MGTGSGPQLNFKDIESLLLKFNYNKITGQFIELVYNQDHKNFIEPIDSSEAIKIGQEYLK